MTQTDHRLSGKRIVLSFPGKAMTGQFRRWLQEGLCGGVIFFRDNYESPSQFSQLVKQVRDYSCFPLPLLMVDQEGGRVQRIPPTGAPNQPSAAEMARLEEKQPGTIRSLAVRTGKALASLGLNVNLSPVMDVATEKRNMVIGDRSFGRDPDTVTKYSLEYAGGLVSAGICPVMKHFPGHGMTREDSHVTLPRTAISEEELGRAHLRPFIYGVNQGLPAILTSHVLYSSFDDTFPATLSAKIVRDLLRGSLGFQGVVISDDLSMGAVRSCFQCEEYVRLATEASVDIMIHCGTEDDQGEMFEELLRLYREEDSCREEKERISLRIEKFTKYLSLIHSL